MGLSFHSIHTCSIQETVRTSDKFKEHGSGDPEFKSISDHQLDLFQIVNLTLNSPIQRRGYSLLQIIFCFPLIQQQDYHYSTISYLSLHIWSIDNLPRMKELLTRLPQLRGRVYQIVIVRWSVASTTSQREHSDVSEFLRNIFEGPQLGILQFTQYMKRYWTRSGFAFMPQGSAT